MENYSNGTGYAVTVTDSDLVMCMLYLLYQNRPVAMVLITIRPIAMVPVAIRPVVMVMDLVKVTVSVTMKASLDRVILEAAPVVVQNNTCKGFRES